MSQLTGDTKQNKKSQSPLLIPSQGSSRLAGLLSLPPPGGSGTTRAHTHQQPSGSCIHSTCDATSPSHPSMTFLMRLVCELGLKQPLSACVETHVPLDGTDRSQIILQPQGLWYKAHLSSCRTRLFSRSLAALSSSLSGLLDRKAP